MMLIRSGWSFPKHWPSATLDTCLQYYTKHNNGIALLTGDKNDLYVVDLKTYTLKEARYAALVMYIGLGIVIFNDMSFLKKMLPLLPHFYINF
jgi:hypothetical protein